jgi:hypothetical protein
MMGVLRKIAGFHYASLSRLAARDSQNVGAPTFLPRHQHDGASIPWSATFPDWNAEGLRRSALGFVFLCSRQSLDGSRAGERNRPKGRPLKEWSRHVSVPTFSILRRDDVAGILWSARACSRFCLAHCLAQTIHATRLAQSQKPWQATAIQNVGVPTLSPRHPAREVRS